MKHRLLPWGVLALLACLPFVLPALGLGFYVGFVRRLMIVALASWRRRSPAPTRAQRSGSPAACRSARKAPAQGSTRSDGSIARRRSTLQNAVRRSTVA